MYSDWAWPQTCKCMVCILSSLVPAWGFYEWKEYRLLNFCACCCFGCWACTFISSNLKSKCEGWKWSTTAGWWGKQCQCQSRIVRPLPNPLRMHCKFQNFPVCGRAHVCFQCTDIVLTHPPLHASLSELRPFLNSVKFCFVLSLFVCLFGVDWDGLLGPCRPSYSYVPQNHSVSCLLLMFLQARISLTTPLPRSCCPLLIISPSDTIFMRYSYFICFSSLLHPLFLSLFLSSFYLISFFESVRRGAVLFTSLSPQARSSFLCLQPVPETRVPSLHPAQPPPTFPQPFAPHHPSKYPHFLPALLPKPATLPWWRPGSSRHPWGGGIASWGWRPTKLCRRRGSVSTAQPARILGIPGPWAAVLRRQISV